jgi:hypothetical protein
MSLQTKPEEFTKSHIIICEGISDQVFFEALLKARNISGIQVARNFGGLSKIESRLNEIEEPVDNGKIKSILLVIDSDSDAKKNFNKAVKQIVKTGRYGVPTQFKERKEMNGRPSIGLLSVPDGSLGCLETMLLDVFLKHQQYAKISQCLEQYFSCSDAKTWDISKQSKMKMNSLISAICRDSPECKVADMWQSKKGFKHLLSDSALDGLVHFLRQFASW